MFGYFTSLSSLPDISKWNTQNVTNMSYMCWCCPLLSSLPDISKCNTIILKYIVDMFNGTKNLNIPIKF